MSLTTPLADTGGNAHFRGAVYAPEGVITERLASAQPTTRGVRYFDVDDHVDSFVSSKSYVDAKVALGGHTHPTSEVVGLDAALLTIDNQLIAHQALLDEDHPRVDACLVSAPPDALVASGTVNTGAVIPISICSAYSMSQSSAALMRRVYVGSFLTNTLVSYASDTAAGLILRGTLALAGAGVTLYRIAHVRYAGLDGNWYNLVFCAASTNGVAVVRVEPSALDDGVGDDVLAEVAGSPFAPFFALSDVVDLAVQHDAGTNTVWVFSCENPSHVVCWAFQISALGVPSLTWTSDFQTNVGVPPWDAQAPWNVALDNGEVGNGTDVVNVVTSVVATGECRLVNIACAAGVMAPLPEMGSATVLPLGATCGAGLQYLCICAPASFTGVITDVGVHVFVSAQLPATAAVTRVSSTPALPVPQVVRGACSPLSGGYGGAWDAYLPLAHLGAGLLVWPMNHITPPYSIAATPTLITPLPLASALECDVSLPMLYLGNATVPSIDSYPTQSFVRAPRAYFDAGVEVQGEIAGQGNATLTGSLTVGAGAVRIDGRGVGNAQQGTGDVHVSSDGVAPLTAGNVLLEVAAGQEVRAAEAGGTDVLMSSTALVTHTGAAVTGRIWSDGRAGVPLGAATFLPSLFIDVDNRAVQHEDTAATVVRRRKMVTYRGLTSAGPPGVNAVTLVPTGHLVSEWDVIGFSTAVLVPNVFAGTSYPYLIPPQCTTWNGAAIVPHVLGGGGSPSQGCFYTSYMRYDSAYVPATTLWEVFLLAYAGAQISEEIASRPVIVTVYFERLSDL